MPSGEKEATVDRELSLDSPFLGDNFEAADRRPLHVSCNYSYAKSVTHIICGKKALFAPFYAEVTLIMAPLFCCLFTPGIPCYFSPSSRTRGQLSCCSSATFRNVDMTKTTCEDVQLLTDGWLLFDLQFLSKTREVKQSVTCGSYMMESHSLVVVPQRMASGPKHRSR